MIDDMGVSFSNKALHHTEESNQNARQWPVIFINFHGTSLLCNSILCNTFLALDILVSGIKCLVEAFWLLLFSDYSYMDVF